MQPGAARGRQELGKEGDGLFSQSPVCSFSLLSVRRQVGLGAVTRGLSEQNPCHTCSRCGKGQRGKEKGATRAGASVTLDRDTSEVQDCISPTARSLSGRISNENTASICR